MSEFSYSKNEKLKSEKEISLLFGKGKWKTFGKIRIIFLKNHPELTNNSNKVGVSVSKRYFKKAVHRNRIKRLLRETYRLNKHLFQDVFGEKSIAMLFWVSGELPKNYHEVETEFLNLCKLLKKD